MRVLDLFSGIGGFSLGLERAGCETIAFCEVDNDCRKVLHKHWPTVPIFHDVTTLNRQELTDHGISPDRIDIICGGFPCQDISIAGKQRGLSGAKSSLWFEYLRLIDEIRPQYVVIENVAALRSNGLATVLENLWQVGYDAEWHVIPASAVGLPHQRERLWIVAYPSHQGRKEPILNRFPDAEWPQEEKPRFGDDWLSERVAEWVRGELVQQGYGLPLKLASAAVKQYGNAVVPQIPEVIGHALQDDCLNFYHTTL